MPYHEGEIVLYFPHANTILRCSYLRGACWSWQFQEIGCKIPETGCKISQYETDKVYPTKRSKNQVLQFRNYWKVPCACNIWQ